MTIPPGSLWVYHGTTGQKHIHRVVGVMGHLPSGENWKDPAWRFLEPKECHFGGPEQVEIATWSITPMLDVPMGMDSGVAGWSWLGPLREFAKNFEPYK